MKFGKSVFVGVIAAVGLGSSLAQAEVTANVGVTNNYLWRGLTQSNNEAAVQGGLDYAHASGFYAGTWVSNVQYSTDDEYSYENDIYFGYSGEAGSITYDVGYLYYNYDHVADFDFGEIYGSIGIENFSASLYIFTNTRRDERLFTDGREQDFSAFETYYGSLDYGVELSDDLELGFHLGYHNGDFSEAFNGVQDYFDYNVSVSKGDISFMISDTDLDTEEDSFNLDNRSPKFVISWSTTIE